MHRYAMGLLTTVFLLSLFQTISICGWAKEIKELEYKTEVLYIEQESVIMKWQPDPGISMPEHLQEHAYNLCMSNDIPFDVFMALIYRESGFIWHDAKPDVNGLDSAGYMQINEVNWGWLQERYGLDVHDPKDNITAGIVILAEYLRKYTLEEALAAYAAGEAGMKSGRGFQSAQKLLDGIKQD